MSQADVKTRIKIKPDFDIKGPPMFKVIYLNDDKTSIEFVIDSLIQHFEYNFDNAQKKTIDIHETGSAVVAVLPYEIAEQKGIEITVDARQSNFPLQIKLEPETA